MQHEVSPLAGVASLDLLCAREYRPMEISSVLYQQIEPERPEQDANDARARCDPAEAHSGRPSAREDGRTIIRSSRVFCET